MTDIPALMMKPSPDLADYVVKLRAGHVTCAHRKLDEAVLAASNLHDRVFAAAELARFHAERRNWSRSLDYLGIVLSLDKDNLDRTCLGAIRVEALIANGDTVEALKYAKKGHFGKGIALDRACAVANALAARDAATRSPGKSDRQRLRSLNLLFKAAGLAEISLRESGSRFLFGNLSGSIAGVQPCLAEDKVSVLYCVHNLDHILEIAVGSILRQSWRNLELVLVDDHSSDDSWRIIESIAEKDTRVVAIRNDGRKGLYRSQNLALELASGEYVSVVSGATFCHPQLLEIQMRILAQDSGHRVVCARSMSVCPDMTIVPAFCQIESAYLRGGGPFLARAREIRTAGGWDELTEFADDEYLQRVTILRGKDAVCTMKSYPPIAIRLAERQSLLFRRKLTDGTRREYLKQAGVWASERAATGQTDNVELKINRSSRKHPFPVPRSLAVTQWSVPSHYNIVLVSDLSLLGGTRRCNQGYVAAAMRLQMRVGLLHWPRFDLRLKADIASEYRAMNCIESVDILTDDDKVTADVVLIHHPPIMNCALELSARIKTKNLGIIVNQLPERLDKFERPYYDQQDVALTCRQRFGMGPVWIPISPLVRRKLAESGFSPLATEDWYPPLDAAWDMRTIVRAPRQRGEPPVIGRHSRDHPTKWPCTESELRKAYCADSGMLVRFLGGARYAQDLLSTWPSNWEVLEFDSISVNDFLDEIDFLVHYTNSAYVEEFGRNVMEAMARGVPVILPPQFREVFDEAARYAEADEVEGLIRRLWESEADYSGQVNAGLEFVRQKFGAEHVERRLQMAVTGIY